MPSRMGAACWTAAVCRPRRPQQSWQRPHDRGAARAARLGRVARRRPRLDLVLPQNAADLDDAAYDIAAEASAAWEAAGCWDDEYAVRRLAEDERSEPRRRRQ
jgi:hypothetical protein